MKLLIGPFLFLISIQAFATSTLILRGRVNSTLKVVTFNVGGDVTAQVVTNDSNNQQKPKVNVDKSDEYIFVTVIQP